MPMVHRTTVAGIASLALTGSLTALAASGSEETGEEQFRDRCLACHAIGCSRTGPKLGGVIGRKAGSLPDFPYSEGLKNAKWTWTEALVGRWLQDPGKMVPGTRMVGGAFSKVTSARERKLIIRYIRSGDTSLDLCGVRRN